MEVYSSSVEDQLVDGLSFKLNPGSSYVVDRQSVSFSQVVQTYILQPVEQKY